MVPVGLLLTQALNPSAGIPVVTAAKIGTGSSAMRQLQRCGLIPLEVKVQRDSWVVTYIPQPSRPYFLWRGIDMKTLGG